jgi:serine kinase
MGKIIGEGSYSKVRLTTRYFSDGTPAYRLASKIINKKKASDDFVTKFLPRELQIVTRLEHPNIVRVYDVVEFDHHVYIFMDWCDKGDLLEYIKAKGHISESRSRQYFKQLLSAVRYLHSLDLAHRDLKCENVLLASREQVRISDFGFARYCRDKNGKRVLSNTYCGSAAYAAPEILQGTSYNPKLYDMWSLGCVLFIMLTGHMPYDESNIQRMLKNQLERILTYPAQVENDFSDSAKNLICHLLEPDVTRRANIEQAIGHIWLNTSSRPGSATGGGDVHHTEQETIPVRYEGAENIPCEGPINKRQACIGTTRTHRNKAENQKGQEDRIYRKVSPLQPQELPLDIKRYPTELTDLTNKFPPACLSPREVIPRQRLSPR